MFLKKLDVFYIFFRNKTTLCLCCSCKHCVWNTKVDAKQKQQQNTIKPCVVSDDVTSSDVTRIERVQSCIENQSCQARGRRVRALLFERLLLTVRYD